MLGFLEKPDPAEIDTDEINAGAYVLERAVIDLIPPGRAVSIEREVFPRLVGQGLYGRRLDGYWMDIGTPERYLQASWDILEGAVETELAGRPAGRSSAPGPRSPPTPTSRPRAVVARRAARSAPAPSIADSRAARRVPDRRPSAEVRGSILARGVEVGEGATRRRRQR